MIKSIIILRFYNLKSFIEDLRADLEGYTDNVKKDLITELDEFKNLLELFTFSKEEYEIYLFPASIKKYQNNLIKYQHTQSNFYPSSENMISNYFNETLSDLVLSEIKYNFSNLHFNLRSQNSALKDYCNHLERHGLDASEFKNPIDFDIPLINDLLSRKIKLVKFGLAQRFFIAYAPEFLEFFFR